MVKLYLDSRARSSGSHENFVISLPYSLDLKTEHIALLDTVCIPHSWNAIGALNHKVYIYEASPQTVPSYVVQETWRVVAIPEGQYSAVTLATALQTALNSGTTLPDNYAVTYNATKNRIQITNALSTSGSYAILGW